MKHDRIGDYRHVDSPCSPDEWETILKAILLNGEPVEGIEARAEVETSKKITITIRRRIDGITVSFPSVFSPALILYVV